MVTPRPQKKVLADLKASILNPALTSHFQCWFYPPSPVRSLLPTGEVQDDRMWSLSCAEAAVPGTSLATGEITNDFKFNFSIITKFSCCFPFSCVNSIGFAFIEIGLSHFFSFFRRSSLFLRFYLNHISFN